MKAGKACWSAALLFLLPACSYLKAELPTQEPYSSFVPLGSYSEYGSSMNLRYYKSVLSPQRWNEVKVLNYSEGQFAFPPLSGYRILDYQNPQQQTQVTLYRELIKGETYMDIISRRQASDHCRVIRSLYRKLDNLEIVEATANRYIWLYGDYLSKYYFLKVGNVVYTFRFLGPPEEYLLYEPDFDLFVKTTVDNYLVYSPRQQLSPTSTQYADNKPKGKGKSDLFSRERLISFFAPVAALQMFPR